jgi:hypothetical protein
VLDAEDGAEGLSFLGLFDGFEVSLGLLREHLFELTGFLLDLVEKARGFGSVTGVRLRFVWHLLPFRSRMKNPRSVPKLRDR